MHVDPAVKVLATTKFPTPGADGPHVPNGSFDMPVVWTKLYGKGRCSTARWATRRRGRSRAVPDDHAAGIRVGGEIE